MEPIKTVLLSPTAAWLLPCAYLLGSIPFGFLLATYVAKTDVRQEGSGNIGATNVARVVGFRLGLLTLFLDAAKGAVPVLIARTVVGDDNTLLIEGFAGLAAFLGHCYPIWLRFRGGKGVATGIGVLMVHQPLVALISVVVFAVVFSMGRMVSLAAMVGALTAVATTVTLNDLTLDLVPLTTMFLILILRHRTNLARIFGGQENRM